MLDWVFAILVGLALIMMVLSIKMREYDTYWNIIFIGVSTALWFILALFNAGGLETPYITYNSTSGTTEVAYELYATEQFIYLSYFFGLMGVLCMIYLIVTIFGYYYQKIDEKNMQEEIEVWDFGP